METVLIVTVVILENVVILYLFLKHIQKLEVYIKARDLVELKNYEKPVPEFVEAGLPDTLEDIIGDKSPDEIKEIFKGTPQ